MTICRDCGALIRPDGPGTQLALGERPALGARVAALLAAARELDPGATIHCACDKRPLYLPSHELARRLREARVS